MIIQKLDKYSIVSAFPIVVLVMKEDRKSVPVILFMSTLLGSIVGSLENTLRL